MVATYGESRCSTRRMRLCRETRLLGSIGLRTLGAALACGVACGLLVGCLFIFTLLVQVVSNLLTLDFTEVAVAFAGAMAMALYAAVIGGLVGGALGVATACAVVLVVGLQRMVRRPMPAPAELLWSVRAATSVAICLVVLVVGEQPRESIVLRLIIAGVLSAIAMPFASVIVDVPHTREDAQSAAIRDRLRRGL